MTPKQKNIALLIGFVLLLWVAHVLSFSKTLQLKSQHAALKEDALLFENGSQKLLSLQKENQYYDSILKSKQISTDKSFQNNLLSTINSFADTTNINIVSFQNPHIFRQEGAEIMTYSFSLRGGFNQIVKLIYQLEQGHKLGKIISVGFIKKRDYRRRSNYLECTVHLQRISS